MRIGILSAELDSESTEENELLWEEISQAGHKPVILNYRDGFVDLNRQKFYFLDKKGRIKPAKVDVVIPRINETDEVSVWTGCLALEALIAQGIASIARPEAIQLAKNKARTQFYLEQSGIKTPRTIVPTGVRITNSTELLKLVEPDPDRILIIKNVYGTLGEGTKRLDSRVSAKSVLDDNREPVLIQEFVETPGFPRKFSDIRIVTVGNKVAAAYKREVKAEVDFRVNIYRWGSPVKYKPKQSEINLALKASQVLGLEIAGVDLFASPNGLLVNEVNASSGFGIGSRLRQQIARSVVDYALEKARQR
jgi:ribosomal protein S6--L-glutamate ligase